MRKSFLLPMIALMMLCVNKTSASSSNDGCRADTLQPRISDDQAFNLCYNSLEYWYTDATSKDTIIYQLEAIIKNYVDVIGIHTTNQEELKRLFEIQKAISVGQCEEDLYREQRRKKRWRKIAAVMTFTTLAEGAAIYFLVR